jgi:hypothetical protein
MDVGRCDGNGRYSPGRQQQRRLSWWNPFGKTGIRDTNPQVVSSKTKSNSDEVDHPRKVQERKDATLLLLATEFRKASAENPNLHREDVVDLAFDRLYAMDVDSKTLLQLRHSLQSALEGQIVDLFRLFGKIDEELLYFVETEETNSNFQEDGGLSRLEGGQRTSRIEEYCEEILRFELERTIDELANPQRTKAPKGADPKQFLQLKRGAIETLLDRRRKASQVDKETHDGIHSAASSTSAEPSSKSQPSPQPKDISWVDADEFGYHESIDDERNRLIRYYQTINLCRSAKLRDEWGFSVIALQSSIPGAGRGVYGTSQETTTSDRFLALISFFASVVSHVYLLALLLRLVCCSIY